MNKTCSICNADKPIEEFPIHQKSPLLYRSMCKPCFSTKQKLAYKANPPCNPRNPAVTSKLCRNCQVEQPAQNFFSEPKNADGMKHACGNCIRTSSRNYARSNHELKAAYYRKRMANLSPEQRELRKLKQRAYIQRNKQKHRARGIIGRAVKRGEIIPQPCSVCAVIPTEAHHDDYSKPLDVIWLCTKHHGERHRKYT